MTKRGINSIASKAHLLGEKQIPITRSIHDAPADQQLRSKIKTIVLEKMDEKSSDINSAVYSMFVGEEFQFVRWQKDEWKPEDNNSNIKDVLRQKVVYVHNLLKKERAEEKKKQQLDAIYALQDYNCVPIEKVGSKYFPKYMLPLERYFSSQGTTALKVFISNVLPRMFRDGKMIHIRDDLEIHWNDAVSFDYFKADAKKFNVTFYMWYDENGRSGWRAMDLDDENDSETIMYFVSDQFDEACKQYLEKNAKAAPQKEASTTTTTTTIIPATAGGVENDDDDDGEIAFLSTLTDDQLLERLSINVNKWKGLSSSVEALPSSNPIFVNALQDLDRQLKECLTERSRILKALQNIRQP